MEGLFSSISSGASSLMEKVGLKKDEPQQLMPDTLPMQSAGRRRRHRKTRKGGRRHRKTRRARRS